MFKIFRNLLVGLIAMTVATTTASAADPENTLVIELETGKVVIEMLPDLAPTHVARIKELAREGFYDGIVFHRVIEGFMAQTGDPTGTGTSGSGKKLRAEFSQEPFVRGIVGMARSQNPHSGDSQFFIMFDSAPSLNTQYTVWGRVIEGMEHVDGIKRGAPGSGSVTDPDHMVSVKVLADIQ
ncbi:peptidylprolyl isomerase [Kiloniella laminariae]|uniref:peptidylprolyl isomerase n=1 Tax=Kiloniella laminariae TaxID=454162 RepID=UPI00036ADCC7